MPTFNQLVRKGRQDGSKEIYCTGSSERIQFSSEETTNTSSPQKRGVCTAG